MLNCKMVAAPDTCKLEFAALVDKLFSIKCVTEKVAEAAKVKFNEFL